ncbi:MAG: branched-chain amino acid ABC transporter ATP-binding protein [Desulfobacterales bacterium S3730MH5]|nr:MAG: branched-chain amino acid ABC transporter ATP-binding protein [Desulfobacterales bacterium S3730MH5]
MLKIRNITAAYGKVNVLWDVSMKVDEKEIVALVGANAAGKTTLLNTISGLIPSVSGSMEFLGRPIKDMPPYRIAKMGMAHVPEGGKLFLDMPVLENLEMGAYAGERWHMKEEMLKQVYGFFPVLKKRSGQLARTLSGGERQMLAMGRGLMARPRLIMFDEPSYGLAPIIVSELFQFIRRLHQEGITILVVEQNIRHALEVSSKGYVLENGRIVLEGGSRHLLENELIGKAYLGL